MLVENVANGHNSYFPTGNLFKKGNNKFDSN
jgi:hypothetical protein